jgi:hypothetical protein
MSTEEPDDDDQTYRDALKGVNYEHD